MQPKNRLNTDEAKVNSNIGRVRARPFRLLDEYVTLQHGSGGKASAALVEQVFFDAYGNEVLGQGGDSGIFAIAQEQLEAGLPTSAGQAAGAAEKPSEPVHFAMSTDSYVVNPIEFPGGNIGDLAVNGTVNDLAVAGATPLAISAAFVLEEGLPIETLRRIVQSMRKAADTAGVTIVTGDTKVVPKGACDKMYITTAGVGVVRPQFADVQSSYSRVQVGDKILISGPIADHGMAVMMARGDLAMVAPIESDTRAVNGLVAALVEAAPSTRWMRDATRGGVATVMNELARGTGYGVVLSDEAIRVREMTRGACDMLGIEPLYVANEGTFIAVVSEEEAEAALAALQQAGAPEAAIIGEVADEPAASVVLVTGFGGTRMVDMLVGDPLPRIC